MIAAWSFSGRKVAVFGLGGSGIATAKSLLAGGAAVAAFDDNPASVEAAAKAGIDTIDLREADWGDFAALVLSPGVPLTHPVPHWSVELARKADVPVIGDIELFSRELPGIDAPFVAITGTNGKSTTTALIAHILRHGGCDTQMGGNIGKAVMTLEPPVSGRHYVIECSSYQIDLAPSLAPDIGILLNLTADHLDRHGTMENYAAIKENLVAGAKKAVICIDDKWCRAIAKRLADAGHDVVAISTRERLEDGYFADGPVLFSAGGGKARRLLSLDGIGSLRGAHNAQNALAAIAACEALGLSAEEIAAGLRSFPGLAHRMEEIRRIGSTVFINDSKATNADAAATALSSFDRVHWIAGGLQKDGGFDVLEPLLSRIAKAYLIGEAAPALAALLGETVRYEISGTIEIAVEHAARDACGKNGGESVVLLSPACASFDQFRNFEARGEAFRSAVMALGDNEQTGGTN